MQNKAHINKTQYEQIGFLKKHSLEQAFIKKKIESIDLSATNEIFVTKYEFESNFLAPPTEEPKFNHWVHTQWNQLVIQFEPSNR